jgi:hypothetical protein
MSPLPTQIPSADQIAPYVNLALTAMTVTVSALATLAPFVLPFILAKRNDARQRTVSDDVKRAGLIAASVAAQHVRDALVAAKDPGSPGGVMVTPAEHKAALSSGMLAAMQYMSRQGLLQRAVEVYGSTQAVEASVSSIMHAHTQKGVPEIAAASVGSQVAGALTSLRPAVHEMFEQLNGMTGTVEGTHHTGLGLGLSGTMIDPRLLAEVAQTSPDDLPRLAKGHLPVFAGGFLEEFTDEVLSHIIDTLPDNHPAKSDAGRERVLQLFALMRRLAPTHAPRAPDA